MQVQISPWCGNGQKIVDWKTLAVDDLHEETVNRTIAKFHYGISAAFYQFLNMNVLEYGRSSTGLCNKRQLPMTQYLSVQLTGLSIWKTELWNGGKRIGIQEIVRPACLLYTKQWFWRCTDIYSAGIQRTKNNDTWHTCIWKEQDV